jgi:regulator of protease activity HflC (stomatin/prohibitin superfamily)
VFVGPGFLPPRIVGAVLFEVFMLVVLAGLFSLQPNEARVLILFGSYKGTVRKSGFHWANPFYSHNRGKVPWAAAPPPDPKAGTRIGPGASGIIYKPLKATISLRARNFNSDKLKVNDKRGNPVEIAAVIVWRVEDTAQAAFDVEDFESYVTVQSEAAIRSVASAYAYDHGEEDEVTLRGGGDEVAHELKKELEKRLSKAGVVVDEARLTHLAYAPEIAHAMLRRQQAEAVIAARQKIVLGAVSMVDMALRELDSKQVVKLDEERKAAMVSNLLVVLCGTEEAAPVINTGTLYG